MFVYLLVLFLYYYYYYVRRLDADDQRRALGHGQIHTNKAQIICNHLSAKLIHTNKATTNRR